MTGDELALLSELYVVRVAAGEREMWVGIDPLMLPEAEHLADAGYLERWWCAPCHDQHWRVTDEGAELVAARNVGIARLN